MEQDTEPTAVLFRVWRTGAKELFALFPEEPAHYDNDGCVTCYAHVGQHGSANLAYCMGASRRATLAEYADLKAELESIGYMVKVYQRTTAKMRAARRAEIRRLNAREIAA